MPGEKLVVFVALNEKHPIFEKVPHPLTAYEPQIRYFGHLAVQQTQALKDNQQSVGYFKFNHDTADAVLQKFTSGCAFKLVDVQSIRLVPEQVASQTQKETSDPLCLSHVTVHLPFHFPKEEDSDGIELHVPNVLLNKDVSSDVDIVLERTYNRKIPYIGVELHDDPDKPLIVEDPNFVDKGMIIKDPL